MTPEAYVSLQEWMDFTVSYGEEVAGDSWIMRHICYTPNVSYGPKLGFMQ
jgi:hypothetical protein